MHEYHGGGPHCFTAERHQRALIMLWFHVQCSLFIHLYRIQFIVFPDHCINRNITIKSLRVYYLLYIPWTDGWNVRKSALRPAHSLWPHVCKSILSQDSFVFTVGYCTSLFKQFQVCCSPQHPLYALTLGQIMSHALSLKTVQSISSNLNSTRSRRTWQHSTKFKLVIHISDAEKALTERGHPFFKHTNMHILTKCRKHLNAHSDLVSLFLSFLW